MRFIKAIVTLLVLAALCFFLDNRWGIVPALGKLLSPRTGLWRNMESRYLPAAVSVTHLRLDSVVTVSYDSNAVPHLTAGDEHDLYFAQGYITARARLWQMDMEARTAAGRLSEVVGSKALRRDIFYRRLGLARAAVLALDSVRRDEKVYAMLEAYADGVNAYISELSPARYPVEFKLLNYAPQPWTPVKSLLILKLMAENLTGGQDDLTMTSLLEEFGADSAREVFRSDGVPEEPVIPAATRWPWRPLSLADNRNKTRPGGEGRHPRDIPGSNNWAVSGRKTATGYPVLANDPHLGLSLPSIWYQQQLSCPGLNVYGVSVPGIPGVMIGFNDRIAWGLTNTAADVVDWYAVQFRDAGKNEYLYDGKWLRTQRYIDTLLPTKGRPVYDTVYYTRYGPVVYEGLSHPVAGFYRQLLPTEGLAMRWTMHDQSDDLRTFYMLDRATRYEEYRTALCYFNCPAQNFIYADADNTIAITCDGKIPLRQRGQGDTLLDGSAKGNEWQGYIPMEQLPAARDPDRGFLSSANEVLTDSSYPYPIDGHFASYARARRINERLAAMNHINADSCRVLQADSYSEFAAGVTPFLLHHLDRERLKNYTQIVAALDEWDYRFTERSLGASLFNNWWDRLYSMIWDGYLHRDGVVIPMPDYDRTALLLEKDSDSYLMRPVIKAAGGRLEDLITQALQQSVDEMGTRYGNIGPGWQWGYSRDCFIGHLGNFGAFGIGPYPADGAPNTVNALSERFGPSWRMVVELGPEVKAYGVLPGGQSGNPGSPYYDNQFPLWREGKLLPLVFYAQGKTGNEPGLSVLTLNN